MSLKHPIKITDRVDISTGRGSSTYRSMVEDMTEEGHLVISTPLHRGIPIIVRREQELELYYFRHNGRYCIDVKVVDFIVSGNLRLIVLERLSEPRKQQRRESFRLPISRRAIVRPSMAGPFPKRPTPAGQEDEEEVSLVNISDTGAALKTKVAYNRGELIYVRIYLGWPTENAPPLEFLCEVKQVDQPNLNEKVFRIGINFTDIEDDTRSHLAKFVVVEQQALLKQMRLEHEDEDEEDDEEYDEEYEDA